MENKYLPNFPASFLYSRNINLPQVFPTWWVLLDLRTFACALFCLELTHRLFQLAFFPLNSQLKCHFFSKAFFDQELLSNDKIWSKWNRPNCVIASHLSLGGSIKDLLEIIQATARENNKGHKIYWNIRTSSPKKWNSGWRLTKSQFCKGRVRTRWWSEETKSSRSEDECADDLGAMNLIHSRTWKKSSVAGQPTGHWG